ncbi:MAG: aldo/keto reductase [Planctomycetia bacterium]|nr:aldo/keto reductase [Planctomycetia bacterium]
MERRDFIKVLGTAGATAAATFGCRDPKTSRVDDISSGEIPPEAMTYRIDPHTNDKISLLGFGCMRFPLRPVKSNVTPEEKIDQEAVDAMVDYAIAHGVNYFDTSPRYCEGASEQSIGKSLAKHPRDKIFIATKMSNMSPDMHGRDASIAMYHRSMDYLQTDYFDYYLIHAVGDRETYQKRFLDNGILDFLLAEKEAGRIRNLGWSFHGEKEFFDWMLDCGVTWDFIQIQLNYLDWQHATGRNVNAEYLYGEMEKRGIPAIVMEPLLGGRLARTNHKARAILKQKEPEKSVASWAFRFAGSLPNVLTVLSGMTFIEHVRDNLLTYAPLVPLNEDEYKLIDQTVESLLSLEFQGTSCTDCKYCMPCSYGLDIPGVFLHYNRCLNEGNFPADAQDENYRKARRAFLIGYDRSVPKLRQANRCTGCRECVPECPQRIDIPEEMRKIDSFVENLRKEGSF